MIDLYTSETPNGWKISIALEEMELPYEVHALKLSKQEQKQDWYVKLNPNGRIPTIVDRDNKNFVVFESGAILLYLADKTKKFWPRGKKAQSVVTQWLMFQMAHVGPMMGQANVFYRYAPEKIPYAIDRYQREVRRILEVLDHRLGEVKYLAGNEYTIADMATWPWARGHDWSGVSIDGLDNLHRWIEELRARPAITRGMAVPAPVDMGERDQKTIDAARKILV